MEVLIIILLALIVLLVVGITLSRIKNEKIRWISLVVWIAAACLYTIIISSIVITVITKILSISGIL
jgi:hypothetical protein